MARRASLLRHRDSGAASPRPSRITAAAAAAVSPPVRRYTSLRALFLEQLCGSVNVAVGFEHVLTCSHDIRPRGTRLDIGTQQGSLRNSAHGLI